MEDSSDRRSLAVRVSGAIVLSELEDGRFYAMLGLTVVDGEAYFRLGVSEAANPYEWPRVWRYASFGEALHAFNVFDPATQEAPEGAANELSEEYHIAHERT